MTFLQQESGEPHGNFTPQERLDLRFYDIISNNDRTEAWLFLDHQKVDLNKPLSLVRHRSHLLITPLNLAAALGHDMMLKFLRKQGGDINRPGVNMKRTALHMAVLGKHITCVQVALTCGAQVDARDIFGNTPMHYAAELSWWAILSLLLDFGGNPSLKDGSGRTCLMKAARNGSYPTFDRILGSPNWKRADACIADGNGDTALHFAARHIRPNHVRPMLIRFGPCKLDPVNHQGHTPLMEAIIHGRGEMVSCLIENYSDVNKKYTTTGKSAFDLAYERGNDHVIEKMLSAILEKPDLTKTMLTLYDWDFHEFTKRLTLPDQNAQGVEGAGAREMSLFYLAVKVRAMEAATMLAKLGHWDYRTGPRLEAIRIDVNQRCYPRQAARSLLQRLSQPRQLNHAARAAVRMALGKNIQRKVPELPLPQSLKDFVLLREEWASLK